MAAPAFDATSKGTGANAASISWSHTVGSGSNRVLVVTLLINSNSVTGNTVTYNSVGLTLLDHAINQSARVEIWYLVNPASGAHTVQANVSSAAPFEAGVVSYTGASQASNPFGATANATGTSTAPTVTVNSTDTTMTICGIAGDQGAGGFSPGTGTNSRWTDTTFANGAQGDKAGAATSTTFPWTLSASDSWVVLAAPLKSPSAVHQRLYDGFGGVFS